MRVGVTGGWTPIDGQVLALSWVPHLLLASPDSGSLVPPQSGGQIKSSHPVRGLGTAPLSIGEASPRSNVTSHGSALVRHSARQAALPSSQLSVGPGPHSIDHTADGCSHNSHGLTLHHQLHHYPWELPMVCSAQWGLRTCLCPSRVLGQRLPLDRVRGRSPRPQCTGRA